MIKTARVGRSSLKVRPLLYLPFQMVRDPLASQLCHIEQVHRYWCAIHCVVTDNPVWLSRFSPGSLQLTSMTYGDAILTVTDRGGEGAKDNEFKVQVEFK